MKNKFIFFGIDSDLNDALFCDLFDNENVTYIKDVRNQFKGIKKFLFRLHHSYFINSIIKLPYKEFWNKLYIKEDLQKYDNVFFIFFYYHFFLFDNNYSSFINKNYNNAKQVVYFDDIHVMRNNLKKIQKTNCFIDAYYVFDENEAKKEKIDFFSLPYSKKNIELKCEIRTDICFVGYGKNRFDTLIGIFEKLEKNGIKTDFHIIGITKENQIYSDKIHYDNPLSYKKTLNILEHSKCALEIQLKDCESYSQRVYESLIFNKKLLTNNQHIKKNKYYNSEYISVFSEIDEIDIDFLKNEITVNYEYKNDFSPIHFLNELENKFIRKGR